MENPEMIASDLSAGFVLKAFPPPHNETDFITTGSRVSMWREGSVEKISYSAGYSLILDLSASIRK